MSWRLSPSLSLPQLCSPLWALLGSPLTEATWPSVSQVPVGLFFSSIELNKIPGLSVTGIMWAPDLSLYLWSGGETARTEQSGGGGEEGVPGRPGQPLKTSTAHLVCKPPTLLPKYDL